jgi:hypothetical protein
MGMVDYESLIFSLLELRDRMSETFSFILCWGLLSLLSRTNERTNGLCYRNTMHGVMTCHYIFGSGAQRGRGAFYNVIFERAFLLQHVGWSWLVGYAGKWDRGKGKGGELACLLYSDGSGGN